MAGVNLLVRVFRGGALWDRAQWSIRENRDLFDSILISFDGPDRQNLHREIASKIRDDAGIEAVYTPNVMTAVEHTQWLADSRVVRQWGSDSKILLLAEDDMLIRSSLQVALARWTAVPQSLLLGSWTISPESLKDYERWHASQPSLPGDDSVAAVVGTNIGDHLRALEKVHAITSVSGIGLSVQDYQRYAHLLGHTVGERPIARGVRAEYFMVVASSAETVLVSRQPIVEVGLHMKRESAVLPSGDWLLDEISYTTFALLQPGRTRLGLRLRMAVRLFLLSLRGKVHPVTLFGYVTEARKIWSDFEG